MLAAAAPNQSLPWFLAVGFLRPHLPFIVPARHLDKYPERPTLPPNRFTPPDAMPSAATECSGTYSADDTHGCVAHEHSFELNAAGWWPLGNFFPCAVACRFPDLKGGPKRVRT